MTGCEADMIVTAERWGVVSRINSGIMILDRHCSLDCLHAAAAATHSYM